MESEIMSGVSNSIESKADLKPATSVEPKRKVSIGALIAMIVIIAGIVVGALYVWGQRVASTGTPLETKTEQPATGLDKGAPQPM